MTLNRRPNYWIKAGSRPFSRRGMLKGIGVAGAGTATLGLVGCGNDDDDDAAPPPPTDDDDNGAAPAPSNGDPVQGGTFQMANRPWEVSMDPHATNRPEMILLWKEVSHPLLEIDDQNMVYDGGVAESHEIVDDTTLVFNLHSGITYHDKPPTNGRPFTAEDVKYSLERLMGPDSTRASAFETISNIEAPDDHTIRITLSQPHAPILYALGATYHVMVAREAVEQYGHLDHPEAVVGVGPFIAERASKDTGATLVRNPNYFRNGLPYLDQVELVPVQDPSVAIPNAFRAGQSDVANLNPADLEQAQQQYPDITWAPSTGAGVVYGMFFNHAAEPWTDWRVRRAVHLVTNRQSIGQAINGDDYWLVAPVNPPLGAIALSEEELLQMPGYRADKDEDIAEARQLLEAAGYDNGFEDLEFDMISSAQSNYSEQWEVFIPQLESLGAQINMQAMEHASFKGAEADKNFDFSMSALLVDAEAHSLLNLIHRTDASRNYCNYSNEEADALIEAQAREFDVEARNELCREASRVLIEDVAYAWTVNQWGFNAQREYVHDYPVNPADQFGSRLVRVWMSA